MAISTNGTVLTRLAGALYNTQMSNATYKEVAALDPSALANVLYARDFNTVSDATVATTLVTNLGLSTVSGLSNWVAAQLTAAGANKGAKVVELLNGFAQMSSDATYGAAATAFNNKVDAALALSQKTDDTGGTFDSVSTAVSGKTFTLTDNIETISGGSGDDSISGALIYSAGAEDGSTLNAGDSILGGTGTDTLRISTSGSNISADTHTPLLGGIEKILVSSNETDATDNLTIDLANAGSDLATVGTYSSTAAGDLTFSNVSKIVGIEAAGKGDLTVSYQSGVTSGTEDTQTITLNGVGTSNTSRSAITSTGIETVNVVSTGSTNIADFANSSAKTINISGNKALTLGASAAATNLKTIDASTATGNITLDTLPTTDIAITGGAGNDTVRIDGSTVSSADSIDLGAGTNTLALTAASNIGSAASGAVVKGISNVYGYRVASGVGDETTDVADLTIAQNVSFISGATAVGVSTYSITDTTADDDAVIVAGGVSFTGLTASVTDVNISGLSFTAADADEEESTGGLTFTATVAMGSDTLADSIKVTLGSTTAAALTTSGDNTSALNITAEDFENITLVSQGLANTVATTTVSDLSTLTINASKALTLTTITGAGSAFKNINASASTDDVNLGSNGLGGAGTVLGGSGNDTLQGSTLSDSISGGAGNDSLTGAGGNDSIYGDAGNDVITGGSGNDKLYGGDGNDTIAGSTGNDTFDMGAGDDYFVATGNSDDADTLTNLTSNDVVLGGDGTDTFYVTGALESGESATLDLNDTTLTQFTGATGMERVVVGYTNDASEADVTYTVQVGDILLGAFGNSLTVSFEGTTTTGYNAGTRSYSTAVDASAVLNTSSTVTASAASGRALTYTLGNGIDKATGSTASDTFTVSNNIFFSATDVLKGGAGNDTISYTDSVGGAVAVDKLAAISSVETISVDSGDAGGEGNFTFTLNDSIVGNNYNSSANKFTVTRAADEDGYLKVDGSLVTASYNLEIVAADGEYTSSSVNYGDTLTGGAGNDTIDGGGGFTNVIDLSYGGTDTVKITDQFIQFDASEADFAGGLEGAIAGTLNVAADALTGFTTYTNGVTSTVQTGYDKFAFQAVTDDGNSEDEEAELFLGDSALVLANTNTGDPTTTNGTYVALSSDDYTEFAGAVSGGDGFTVNKVNIITGRGYDSYELALAANDSDETASDEDGQAILGFYNSSTMRFELYYIDDSGEITSSTARTDELGFLLAYSTEVTLTGVAGFASQNFSVVISGT